MRSSEFRTPKVPADFSPYVTEQVFYTSKDGTRVPMFITRRRDAPRDGNRPVMLYGYGGFNVTLSPAFSPSIQGWLEMGGVYAVANLRGGGEYGEEWHLAGTKLHKQNVFDDFIAAAEYLIREKYTNPKRLAILGRSNGGLLVGAALTQRPDLFGAALPGVGVMDMLRYHTASANARQWSSDYGLVGGRGRIQGTARVLAGAQREGRRVLSADARDDGRSRRSRRALAQLQVRRGAAACAGLREPGDDPHRDARGAWSGEAGVDADRGHRRSVRLCGECARDAGAGGVSCWSVDVGWRRGARNAVELASTPLAEPKPPGFMHSR